MGDGDGDQAFDERRPDVFDAEPVVALQLDPDGPLGQLGEPAIEGDDPGRRSSISVHRFKVSVEARGRGRAVGPGVGQLARSADLPGEADRSSPRERPNQPRGRDRANCACFHAQEPWDAPIRSRGREVVSHGEQAKALVSAVRLRVPGSDRGDGRSVWMSRSGRANRTDTPVPPGSPSHFESHPVPKVCVT